MSDPYKPLSSGSTWAPTAKSINGTLRAAKDLDEHKYDETGSPATMGPAKWPKAYNGLGTAIDSFAVLGFGLSLVLPSVVPFEANDSPLFAAALPASDSPFSVTRGPIPAGGLGDVVTHGPAVVRVNVTNAAHTRAVVSAGITANLVSAASGGVPILWKESGTGLKMAQVLLGAASEAATAIDGASYGTTNLLGSPINTPVEIGSLTFPSDGTYLCWANANATLAFTTNNVIDSASVGLFLGYDSALDPISYVTVFGSKAGFAGVFANDTRFASTMGYRAAAAGHVMKVYAVRYEGTGSISVTWSQATIAAGHGSFGFNRV